MATNRAMPPPTAPHSLSVISGPAPITNHSNPMHAPNVVHTHLWDRTPLAGTIEAPPNQQIPALCFEPTALRALRQHLLTHRQLARSERQLTAASAGAGAGGSGASVASRLLVGAKTSKISELPAVAARLRARMQIVETDDKPELSLIVSECVPVSSAQQMATRAHAISSAAGHELWIDVYRYEKRRASPDSSLTASKEKELNEIRRSIGVLTNDLSASGDTGRTGGDDDSGGGDDDLSLISVADCTFNTAQYVSFMQQQKIARSSQRDDSTAAINQFMLIRMVCAPHTPIHSMAIRGEILVPSYTLYYTPIAAVPLLSSPLALSLESGDYPRVNPSNAAFGAGMATGFLTIDQHRQAVPLETDNAFAHQTRFIGLWFTGVKRADDPYVWTHCLRFMFSASIKERISQSPHTFLVLFFNPNKREHSFLECGFKMGGPQFTRFEFGEELLLEQPTARSGAAAAGAAAVAEEAIWLNCRAVTDSALNRKFRHAEKLVHEIETNRIGTTAMHQPLITSPEKEVPTADSSSVVYYHTATEPAAVQLPLSSLSVRQSPNCDHKHTPIATRIHAAATAGSGRVAELPPQQITPDSTPQPSPQRRTAATSTATAAVSAAAPSQTRVTSPDRNATSNDENRRPPPHPTAPHSSKALPHDSASVRATKSKSRGGPVAASLDSVLSPNFRFRNSNFYPFPLQSTTTAAQHFAGPATGYSPASSDPLFPVPGFHPALPPLPPGAYAKQLANTTNSDQTALPQPLPHPFVLASSHTYPSYFPALPHHAFASHPIAVQQQQLAAFSSMLAAAQQTGAGAFEHNFQRQIELICRTILTQLTAAHNQTTVPPLSVALALANTAPSAPATPAPIITPAAVETKSTAALATAPVPVPATATVSVAAPAAVAVTPIVRPPPAVVAPPAATAGVTAPAARASSRGRSRTRADSTASRSRSVSGSPAPSLSGASDSEANTPGFTTPRSGSPAPASSAPAAGDHKAGPPPLQAAVTPQKLRPASGSGTDVAAARTPNLSPLQEPAVSPPDSNEGLISAGDDDDDDADAASDETAATRAGGASLGSDHFGSLRGSVDAGPLRPLRSADGAEADAEVDADADEVASSTASAATSDMRGSLELPSNVSPLRQTIPARLQSASKRAAPTTAVAAAVDPWVGFPPRVRDYFAKFVSGANAAAAATTAVAANEYSGGDEKSTPRGGETSANAFASFRQSSNDAAYAAALEAASTATPIMTPLSTPISKRTASALAAAAGAVSPLASTKTTPRRGISDLNASMASALQRLNSGTGAAGAGGSIPTSLSASLQSLGSTTGTASPLQTPERKPVRKAKATTRG